MNRLNTSIDKSSYHQQTAAVKIARPDTAAGCGNLAYVMKNATIVVETVRPLPVLSIPEPSSLEMDSNQAQEQELTHPSQSEMD